MRERIRLDTMKDIENFVNIVSEINKDVYLEDETGLKVSAKSILGALYTMEWNHIYCCCDIDISGKIIDFIR